MKTLNLLFLITIIALFVGGCNKEEIQIEPVNENEQITFYDMNKNTVKTYNSEQEFMAFISNKPEYTLLVKKMEALKIEREYIEENQLYDLDENTQEFKNYMSKFGKKLKVAAGALHDGYNGSGKRLGYTSYPNPRLRRSRWDKASSWAGLGGQFGHSVILCGQTWYRGSKCVIQCGTGNPGKTLIVNLDGVFDNNTRSYR